MVDQAPATKADIERIESKLDHILRATGEVLEALKRLQRKSDLAAAEWNKAVPLAGKIDDFGDGGGI
jgi:hypothetical protein